MSASQAVFLFDICAFSEADSVGELRNALKCLRRVCLRLITELSRNAQSFKFGFKFFDGKGSVSQVSDRFPFSEVNLEAFENFETEISRRYERYASLCKAVAKSEDSNETAIKNERMVTLFGKEHNLPIKVLNLILTQILCEFQWNVPEISSPVRSCNNKVSQKIKKNYVFLISSLPENESSLTDYFGVSNISCSKMKNLLMPSALYKKFVVESNLSLVWLETTTLSYVKNVETQKHSSTQLFRKAISELCGAVIPFQVLAERNLFTSKNLPKVFDVQDTSTSESSAADSENVHLPYSGYFLPFSCLFEHYIYENHMMQTPSSQNRCSLSFSNKFSIKFQLLTANTYSLSLLDVCGKTDIFSPEPKRSHRSCVGKEKSISNPEVEWCNFLCQYTIPQGFYGSPDSTFIGLPACQSSDEEKMTLHEINQILFCKNQSLVLKCETRSGFTSVGILSPLSEWCSVISVFISTPALLTQKLTTKNAKAINNVRDFVNDRKETLLKRLENFNKEDCNVLEKFNSCDKLKPFTMASAERWFVPAFHPNGIVAEMKRKHINEKTGGSDFLSKLQCHYQNEHKVNQLKKISESMNQSGLISTNENSDEDHVASNPHPMSNDSSQKSEIAEITPPVPTFKDEDELLKHVEEIYQSTLLGKESVTRQAQSLMSITMEYFNPKQSATNFNKMNTFMNTHILAAATAISQKYNDKTSLADTQQKITEYQLQVILHLELFLILPSSFSACVNKVTALLRALSFVVGPFELSQFLRDTIVGNYGTNLRNLLVEIGDELNMPIISEPFSASSSETESPTKSPTNAGTKSSMLSQNSVPSWKSNSSSSQRSQKSNFEVRNRRLLTEGFKINQSRQILVPVRLLKKRKISEKHEAQVPRKSPRLAAKNNALRPNTNVKASRICRNLFNAGVKPKKRSNSSSPEKGGHKRRKLLTPKGHRTLKTNYVPETPSPKQGSSFQRRIARRQSKSGAVSEVMESPVSCRNQDAPVARLNLLRQNGSFYNTSCSSGYGTDKMQKPRSILNDKPKMEPSHLFSEILHSPVAEHPGRRCSKRLFQNSTPPKSCPSVPKTHSSISKTHSSISKTHPSTPKRVCPSTPKRVCPSTPKRVCPSTPKRVCPSTPTRISPSTPTRISPSIPRTYLNTPPLNLQSIPKTFPSTPLKSILKRTPSKNVENGSAVDMFSSPSPPVILSLPMHEFPTPDKSTSPVIASEDISTQKAIKQSIEIPQIVSKYSSSVSKAFFTSRLSQQNHTIPQNSNKVQNSQKYNQMGISFRAERQHFSSPRKKSKFKSESVFHGQDRRSSNRCENTSLSRFSTRLQFDKETSSSSTPSDSNTQNMTLSFNFTGETNDIPTINESNTVEAVNAVKCKQKIRRAVTNYVSSPNKATRNISFTTEAQYKDLELQIDDSMHSPSVNKTPSVKAMQIPTSKNNKLYTPPTTSSILHLATSPVIFTKKNRR